ncbi:MAG TPA: TRAM domain-containing protein [Acidimicrobiales bacterium]|nr:TRAM domain-containing protein [Acidimicrobiales bacterium]
MPELLRIDGVAVGGDGVAREASGRVVFVEGALPGEVVTAEVTAERRDYARAVATGVVEPAPGRVSPPCPFVAEGCGGCGWQHASVATQRELAVAMVTDALVRFGGVEDPAVGPGPDLAAIGYRTTLRGVADSGGRFALRRRHAHDLVAVPGCLVAHPLVAEVAAAGRFPPGAAVTIRAGARTGDRLVVVDGAGAEDVRVPDGVRVVTGDELDAGRRAWLFEEVAGTRLRVSARSFFQAGPEAAEALVAAVISALGDGEGISLADLYGGVGLFAATAGRGFDRVTVVESSASSCADARVNLAGRPARVMQGDVGRWRPRRTDAVVADPPRSGLGRAGARVVAGTGAGALALVSCDAGALGRDVALLRRHGYGLDTVTLVDAFPHTPHVEVVSGFTGYST